jgi:hypothetical protein
LIGVRSRLLAVMARPKLKKGASKAYFLVAFLLLAIATFYVGWHANLVYSNVQDATVYPYLFKGPHLHDILLPGQHANILKFPLFWLQSIFPYTFTTFSLVNLGLLFSTVFGWCFLLAYIFGKQHLPLIFILMAAILLGSTSLSLNLIETTIRNIEYPIGLGFVIVVSRLLKNRPLRHLHLLFSIVIAALFALSLAGDSFMLYGFIAPLLVVIGIDWLRVPERFSRRSAAILSMVVGVTLLGFAIRRFVSLAGIAYYYVSPSLQTKIMPLDSFGPSLAHASSQILDLFGANIFNQSPGTGNSLYFANFVLLMIALAGIVSIMLWAFRSHTRTTINTRFETNRFVLAVIAASFFTTLLAYVFSGLVLTKLSNGTFADASNIRYITLLPFLLIVGALFILTRYYTVRRPLTFIVAGLLLLTILMSVSSIKNSRLDWDNFASATQSKIQSIISIIEANHVHQIISGDSLAAPIRFWSHDKIKFASLIGCKQYIFQGTRLSWRQPSPTPINTALVIDRVGFDGPYLGRCSDPQLQAIFGIPAKVEIPKQYANAPNSVEVWIYHYDIRQKLPNGR